MLLKYLFYFAVNQKLVKWVRLVYVDCSGQRNLLNIVPSGNENVGYLHKMLRRRRYDFIDLVFLA